MAVATDADKVPRIKLIIDGVSIHSPLVAFTGSTFRIGFLNPEKSLSITCNISYTYHGGANNRIHFIICAGIFDIYFCV